MRVAVLSTCRYPNGDAEAVRVHSLAKLFVQMGADVEVIARGTTGYRKRLDYKGIAYMSIRREAKSKVGRAFDWLGMKHSVKACIDEYKPEVIVTEDMTPSVLHYLKKLMHKENVHIIYDCVEWYSKEQFKMGRFSLSYNLKNWVNSRWVTKDICVIAISKYLYDYYKNKGIRVIRIPVIMENVPESITSIRENNTSKVKILYAGSPGKKDYISTILEGMALLQGAELERLEITIAGINEKQLIQMCGAEENTLLRLKRNLKVLGRIEREDVEELLRVSDFTIFLRSQNQRYAKAGFPTKFVESMMNGIPVITNYTSDLKEYLVDMNNGIVINGEDKLAVKVSLERIAHLTQEELLSMKQNSLKTANDFFLPEHYTKLMWEFVEL